MQGPNLPNGLLCVLTLDQIKVLRIFFNMSVEWKNNKEEFVIEIIFDLQKTEIFTIWFFMEKFDKPYSGPFNVSKTFQAPSTFAIYDFFSLYLYKCIIVSNKRKEP